MRRLSCAIAVAAVMVTSAQLAVAARYEIYIDIASEEDLYDLFAADQISEDTFNTLLELYQRGVDLNEASREELYTLPNLTYSEVDAILTYRNQAGRIRNPVALVANGVLSERKLVSVAPFLVIRERESSRYATDGWVKIPTRWSVRDDGLPPASLRARVHTLRNMTAGIGAVLTRQRLGDISYDPNRDALSASPADTGFVVPKGYVQWDGDDWGAIAGTYSIGFGQRLTFDTTDQYTPNGFYHDDELSRVTDLTRECKESTGELQESPCAGEARYQYVTPDFRWTTNLLGVAAGAEDIEVGPGKLQVYGFASHQPQAIYQYELTDAGECDDPRNDDDPACSAPDVFVRRDTLLMPTSEFSYRTLPNMYTESTAGANVSYAFDRRSHIGVTGYGSDVSWLVEGMDLDFQEWSRTPFGGPFGAVGIDGAYGTGHSEFFAEVTRSFDSQPGDGGGLGALVRNVNTWGEHEVEAAVRAYGTDFNNPHARGISAPDEHDGLRARDELGGRVRYSGELRDRINLRTSLDVWQQPSLDIYKTQAYVRGDVDLSDVWDVGLWTQYQDKNLADSGRGQCFETSDEEDEITGEPIPCAGQKLQLIGRVGAEPHDDYSIGAQLQGELLDDKTYMDRYRRDVSAWLTFVANPVEPLRLRGRARYLFEDISDNAYKEQSMWTYADVTYQLENRSSLRVRYDFLVRFDERDSTLGRQPSPEHWLWVELTSRF